MPVDTCKCLWIWAPERGWCPMSSGEVSSGSTVVQNAAEAMKRATINFDGGGRSPGPVTAACTVQLSDGSVEEDVKQLDRGTHNIAEREALMLGLRVALEHGERHVIVKGDSMLVVKQVNREWKARNGAMRHLRTQAEELLALFETWHVEWIPRKENQRADELGRVYGGWGPAGSRGLSKNQRA